MGEGGRKKVLIDDEPRRVTQKQGKGAALTPGWWGWIIVILAECSTCNSWNGKRGREEEWGMRRGSNSNTTWQCGT